MSFRARNVFGTFETRAPGFNLSLSLCARVEFTKVCSSLLGATIRTTRQNITVQIIRSSRPSSHLYLCQVIASNQMHTKF